MTIFLVVYAVTDISQSWGIVLTTERKKNVIRLHLLPTATSLYTPKYLIEWLTSNEKGRVMILNPPAYNNPKVQ